MRKIYALAALGFIGSALAAACGSTDASTFASNFNSGEAGTGEGEPNFNPPLGGSDGSIDPSTQAISISPADPSVTFTSGQAAPTVQFTVTTSNGTVVPATFAIDRGELGGVAASGGLFTASGTVGGKAKITATFNGRTVATTVTVKVKVAQNGVANAGDAGGGGSGGNGGVGGEGPGVPVDPTTAAVLGSTPLVDAGLSFLYPYDKTVWPRGILAPLLQWKIGAQGDYDAVKISLSETSFEYEGTFTKTKAPFDHHPIPQQAWKQLLASNAGEEVTVTLTFSKGNKAYGPIIEKWRVASAPLKGTVYYNSYGTRLAKNYTGAIGGDGKFGGATLAIKGGSTDPELVAGGNGDSSYCRVCHSVAANGSLLITQRSLGGERRFSTYDLKASSETTMSPEGNSANFAWPAIYPDGSLFLNDSSSADGSSSAPNVLYQTVSGAGPKTPVAVTTTGWPSGFRAALPSFAPDGKSLAFTFFGGIPQGDGGVTAAATRTLGTMKFDKASNTFSDLTALYTPPNPAHTAIYPSFLPTNDAVVFQVETRYNTRDYGGTRSDADVAPPDPRATRGTRAELWWIDLKTKTPHRLDALNGINLPSNPATGHDADDTLNYEPTVNPVPSGGYAWVVFTSRRQYGNVATINPYYSDPRYHDLTSTPTPKKLWVAAIDLNAPPGTDPSHPAFYLPAQELLAGNSRGYWVVDPCKSDNQGCETGDECCGGFCRPGQGGALVCTAQVPTCAQEFEKCNVSADCCNSGSYQCINNRCAFPLPK